MLVNFYNNWVGISFLKKIRKNLLNIQLENLLKNCELYISNIAHCIHSQWLLSNQMITWHTPLIDFDKSLLNQNYLGMNTTLLQYLKDKKSTFSFKKWLAHFRNYKTLDSSLNPRYKIIVSNHHSGKHKKIFTHKFSQSKKIAQNCEIRGKN
jgi:hypothetical protein